MLDWIDYLNPRELIPWDTIKSARYIHPVNDYGVHKLHEDRCNRSTLSSIVGRATSSIYI